MRDSGEFFLMIDGHDLFSHNKALYHKLLSWPGDIITIMDGVA